MDCDESSPERVYPKSEEAAFVLGIWILQRQGVWVPECLLRVGKTHAVLAQGGSRTSRAATWVKNAGRMDYKRAETEHLTESIEIYIIHIYIYF